MTTVQATTNYEMGTDAELTDGLPPGTVVLVPTVPGLPAKVLTDDLARLWSELGRSRNLASLDNDSRAVVEPLTLDGVFAVGDSTADVTGPAAAPLLGVAPPPRQSSHTAKLSSAALRLAQRRLDYSLPEITAVLYRHNTAPGSDFWHDKLRGPNPLDRIRSLVGSQWMRFEKTWDPQDRTSDNGDGWVFFRPRADSPGRTQYKLYVSTLPASLSETVLRVLATLEIHGGPPFKIGADVAGLLRPDKIVVYLDSVPAAERLAGALDAALVDLDVQGVPFSFQIGSSGAVSGGIDPTDDPFGFYSEGNSWRYRLCRELAQALKVSAALGTGSLEPWQCALQRISLADVDPQDWRPKEWRSA